MHIDFDEDEPQAVRDERLAAERAERRAMRNSAPVQDYFGAHIGAAIVTVALVALGWTGKVVALGIVGGVFLLWFGIALTWLRVDGDRGRHALQRAYKATFWWGDGF
ncbi:hypothetical protein [Streptomyces sp. NPDC004050]